MVDRDKHVCVMSELFLVGRLFWWCRSYRFHVFVFLLQHHVPKTTFVFLDPHLVTKYLTNNLSPGSRTPRHGPDFNFLCTSFSFLPVDFVSGTSNASSMSFFNLSRYSLWLHLDGESFLVWSIRSIGSRGLLPNNRWYAEYPLLLCVVQ